MNKFKQKAIALYKHLLGKFSDKSLYVDYKGVKTTNRYMLILGLSKLMLCTYIVFNIFTVSESVMLYSLLYLWASGELENIIHKTKVKQLKEEILDSEIKEDLEK